MEIRHSKPRSLGVEKLVYIGDDSTGAPTGLSTGQKIFLGASAIAIAYAIFGRTKKQKKYGTLASIPAVVMLAI